jgi:two-component system OmpR family sensor kinase
VRLIAEVARLTEAVEARDAFLAVAAHELRNPMTPIIGRIQILARAFRRSDLRVERLVQGLDEIEWLITRYLKRANVLLDVSRITSGKLALDRLPVDVCEVARGHRKF